MILTIHVKPNAKTTKVVAQLDDRTFVVALHAPATEGKANEELREFLHDLLGIPKTFIALKRGQQSRIKHIEIPDGSDLSVIKNSAG